MTDHPPRHRSAPPNRARAPRLGTLLLCAVGLTACDDATEGATRVDNLPPTTADVSVEVPKNQPTTATLPGTDPDGDALTWSLVTEPSHGTVTLEQAGGSATAAYVPDAGFVGTDTFDYAVSDGEARAVGTVTVEVIDRLPVLEVPGAVVRPTEGGVEVVLRASDPDGDPLSLEVTTPPAHGTLTGVDGAAPTRSPGAPGPAAVTFTVTYVPDEGISEGDVFGLAVTDGRSRSPEQLVTVEVNGPPEAEPRTVSTFRGEPVAIELSGADPDGDVLSFQVVQAPEHGTLSGPTSLGPTSATLTYTPEPGAPAGDELRYRVDDGLEPSDDVAVEIEIENRAPVARIHEVTLQPDQDEATITLRGSDPDGDPLRFQVVRPTEHGTLSGPESTGPATATVRYRMEEGYAGLDGFRFRVLDGPAEAPSTRSSRPASVTIRRPATEPVASDAGAVTEEDTPVSLTLTASDPVGSDLTFSIVSGPTLGSLGALVPGGSPVDRAEVVYTPDPDRHGADEFTFRAENAFGLTATATVSIEVTPVNDTPMAAAQAVTTEEDAAVTVTLSGSDPDGDALDFAVAGAPSHGSLGAVTPVSPTSATVRYTPSPDFNGGDAFTFTVEDGTTTSPAATVSVTVEPVNDAPSFTGGGDVTVPEDAGPWTVDPWATDVHAGPSNESGQALAFRVTGNSAPGLFSSGPAVSPAGALTFTPADDAHGSATVELVLEDDGGTSGGGADTSPPESFTITVTPVNDPPEAVATSATVVEDESVEITLSGSDVDGDPLELQVATPPDHGTLGPVTSTGATTATVTYTPDPGYDGPDAFTIEADDGTATSEAATVTVDVRPANERPSITLDGTELVGPGDTGIEAATSPSYTIDDLGANPDLVVEYAFGDPEGAAGAHDDLWYQIRFVSTPEVTGPDDPFIYLSPFDRSNDIPVKEVRLPDGDDLGYVWWQSSLDLANEVLGNFRIRLNYPGRYELEIVVLDNGRSGACPSGIEIPTDDSGIHPLGIRATQGRNGDLVGGDPERCMRESEVTVTLDNVSSGRVTFDFLAEGSGG